MGGENDEAVELCGCFFIILCLVVLTELSSFLHREKNVKYMQPSYCFVPPFCLEPCLWRRGDVSRAIPIESVQEVSVKSSFAGPFRSCCHTDPLALAILENDQERVGKPLLQTTTHAAPDFGVLSQPGKTNLSQNKHIFFIW